MIAVAGLTKTFGKLTILDGLSLEVSAGQVAALVGPSGGGKSTLLRCINGLETFQAGSIAVGPHELTPASSRDEKALLAVRRHAGMVFQQFHLFPHLSVLKNVLAGPTWALDEPEGNATPRAMALLERVGMQDKRDARPGQLSGGQQQRVAIARAMAVNPSVMLFDEPTSALDPANSREVQSVIASLAGGGLTMLIVTHDMDFVRNAATVVHRLEKGKVAASGTPAEMLEDHRTT